LIPDIFRRIWSMPTPVFLVFAGVCGGAALSAVAVMSFFWPHLREGREALVPLPMAGLIVCATCLMLMYGLYRGNLWYRLPAIFLSPFSYFIEYGLSQGTSESIRGLELVVSLAVWPALIGYCLYASSGGRKWFYPSNDRSTG
jgi:hypothetical protein